MLLLNPSPLPCVRAGVQVIPAENLVAARQAATAGPCPLQLFATASCAAEARLMLEALEVGVDGVLLRGDSAEEVGRGGGHSVSG